MIKTSNPSKYLRCTFYCVFARSGLKFKAGFKVQSPWSNHWSSKISCFAYPVLYSNGIAYVFELLCIHIRIPLGWLRRSHITQYHCGYYMFRVAVRVHRLYITPATVQCSSCRVSSGYPHSYSSLQWPQRNCVIWDLHSRSEEPVCVVTINRYQGFWIYIYTSG